MRRERRRVSSNTFYSLGFGGAWGRRQSMDLSYLLPAMVTLYIVQPDFLVRAGADVNYQPPAFASFLMVIIGWLYFAIMESSIHQATLGKKALSLKVTDLDGFRISFSTASLRAWVWYASGLGALLDSLLEIDLFYVLIYLLVAVSCLVVAFTERKQGLHDMMAKCYVVRRPPALGPAVRQRW